jgi:hypothetical protein
VSFGPSGGHDKIVATGTVVWVNAWREEGPNPGMGIRFDQMSDGHRAALEKIVRWVAITPTIPQPELDRLGD